MKMEKKNSSTTQNNGAIKYAGFWVRFLATWIDMAIFVLPIGFVIYVISGGNLVDFSSFSQSIAYAQEGKTLESLQHMPRASAKWEPIFELLIAAVTILFWKKWAGATPGKKLLGIYVVDAKTHGEINNKQAIIRYISYIISTIPLAIGFIMVAFHKQKRSLHDILADTLVIYKKG